MIKLNRPDKPLELTEETVTSLTNDFKNNGKSVWAHDFIKLALAKMSSNKCAFCEAKLGEESKYLEVEHFHHKGLYKDEVVEWDNLLPSCRRCNGTKGSHDTKAEPIINPCKDDPKEHLELKDYRLKGKTNFGKFTVSTLYLNDPDRLVTPRFLIGNALLDKIEDYQELVDDVVDGSQTSTIRKNRIKNGVKQLLENGLKDKEYSSTYSTILLKDPEYQELKNKMIFCELWTSEHNNLEDKISLNML